MLTQIYVAIWRHKVTSVWKTGIWLIFVTFTCHMCPLCNFFANLLFILWFSLIIFHCLKAGFVPCPGDILMVPALTTRGCEYCWWFLLEMLFGHTWWHYDMETLLALLALYERNPLLISGFPSQRSCNVVLSCFLWCQPEQTVEQSVKLLVIFRCHDTHVSL